VVLVNRGWLRAPDAATVDLRPFRVEGPVRLTGIVVPFFPKRAPGGPDRRSGSGEAIRVARPTADPDAAPVWFRPDDDAVRASLPYPVADFIVQALPDDAAGDADGSQPIRLGPPELDRGPHLSYAIQWFSFAAIALIGWTIVVVRRWTAEERRQTVENPGARVSPPQ